MFSNFLSREVLDSAAIEKHSPLQMPYMFHMILYMSLTLLHKIFHITIELFGLEGILMIILFLSPCHRQGHLPLHQVAQRPIQLDSEHLQGWQCPQLPWTTCDSALPPSKWRTSPLHLV